MSKKGSPMDLWFQIYNFPRCIPKDMLGLYYEYFEIDPKLYFPENLQLFREFPKKIAEL